MIEKPAVIRPLLYTRLRLYLGGQAEYIASVLVAEQAFLYDELTRFRAAGKSDGDAEIETTKDQLRHIIDAKKDAESGLLDPRLEFIKVRVYRGGQAETLTDLFLDRQDALLEELGGLRAAGSTEDDEQVAVIRDRLVWLASILRELGVARIDLAGPDVDPRLREAT